MQFFPVVCDRGGVLAVVVLSAASIGAAKGGGYARYLEGKTVEVGRGDYYLTRDGEPVQAPGRCEPGRVWRGL